MRIWDKRTVKEERFILIQGLCLVGSVVAQPITVGNVWSPFTHRGRIEAAGSHCLLPSYSPGYSQPSMKVLPFKHYLVALWAKPLACGFLGAHSKLKLHPGVWLISHNPQVCSRFLFVVVDNGISFSRFTGTSLHMHTTFLYLFSHWWTLRWTPYGDNHE